jgi:Domain of unknown function (DUF4124)
MFRTLRTFYPSFALPTLMALGVISPIACAAQTIYTCVDTHGAAAYQSTPCPDGMRTSKVREYQPVAPDPALIARSREIEREMDARNRRSYAGVAAIARNSRASRRPQQADACETAKARREKTLEDVGLKRNFDLLSRLDRGVWAVCKGR